MGELLACVARFFFFFTSKILAQKLKEEAAVETQAYAAKCVMSEA